MVGVHDSYRFTRVGNRETFLPIGPMGSWDRFNISLANNPRTPPSTATNFVQRLQNQDLKKLHKSHDVPELIRDWMVDEVYDELDIEEMGQ